MDFGRQFAAQSSAFALIQVSCRWLCACPCGDLPESCAGSATICCLSPSLSSPRHCIPSLAWLKTLFLSVVVTSTLLQCVSAVTMLRRSGHCHFGQACRECGRPRGCASRIPRAERRRPCCIAARTSPSGRSLHPSSPSRSRPFLLPHSALLILLLATLSPS